MRRLLILPLLAFLGACNLAGQSAPAPTTELSTPTPEPASAPASLPQTHVDDVLGFAVDYPEGWWTDGQAGTLLQIFSAGYTPSEGGRMGFPDDHTKIEFIPGHPGDSRSIEQRIADMRAEPDGPGGSIVSEAQITLQSGLTAHRLTMTGGMGGDTMRPVLLVVINGRILQVAGYGETSRFDEIVRTLRGV